MGDHDQLIWHSHVDDAHRSIHDDGRTLRPVLGYEYRVVGGFGALPLFAPPRDSRRVFLFRGQKLLPDTVDIHSTDQFDVTQWESIYSSVLTLGHSAVSRASFAPIVDESYRIIGHVGWADGNDILVPEETVRNNRRFWSLLQEQRLDGLRKWLLKEADGWDRGPLAEAQRYFQTRGPTSPPPPPVRLGNCVYHPPGISLRPTIWDQARRGPFPENTEEVAIKYLNNLVDFVKGGGDAFVGRHFQKPDQAFYLSPHPHPLDGEIGSPKKPFSSGYEFLVLVDPEGKLQGVMEIRNNLKTEDEWVTEKAMEVLDIADKVMTVLMVIEVAPIAVVLLRAGVTIAKGAAIKAIRLVLDAAAKAALKRLLEREAKRLAEEAAVKAGEFAVEEVVIDAKTLARWRERGARLHLGEPGGETVGVGELWRDGAEAPEQYWAKSGAKAEKHTLPKTPEQIGAEAEAAEYKRLKAEGRTPKKKAKPTEANKPEEFKPTTYVTEPRPIEGPNKGIPDHMPDASPAEKQKWLQTDEGEEWLEFAET